MLVLVFAIRLTINDDPRWLFIKYWTDCFPESA